MNANKKNFGLTNGWILCPSKSLPGKFYYFNVLNGEAAWSLNEVDKEGVTKDSRIHKIADKSHDYPEPTTLPDHNSITSYNIGSNFRKPEFLRNNPCSQRLPTFGQVAFPKYVGNVDSLMPNVVWTPVQLPMPMFQCPESKKPMFDKVTQTSESEIEIFIQTCDIPLCKRFKNYEKPYLKFDDKNKIVNKLSAFQTSTPNHSVFANKVQSRNVPKPLIKESVLNLNNVLPNQKIAEVKKNVKPSLNVSSKVESTKSNVLPKIDEEKIFDDLDHSDLRFLLLAKRRKSVDDMTDTAVETKKTKAAEVHQTPKKKVTFDLSAETDDDATMSDVTRQENFIPLSPNYIPTTDTPKTSVLHLKDKSVTCINDTFVERTPHATESVLPTYKNNAWYIVVDADVLLLDYELIEELVLSDEKCKLVIPHAVRVDIEGLCIGDCRGQKRVINARRLTRRMATPPSHYIVEPPPEDVDILVTTESILNCCLKAINKNYYVVLITNDPHLQIKANSLNVTSYRLNDVKYGVNIKPDLTSDRNNIKINNSKDEDRINSLNQNKTNSFKDLSTVRKQLFLNSDKKFNSFADCDKLINITKPKYFVNHDSDSSISDISREVQNLNLKEKYVLKSHKVDRNPFLPQNVGNGFVNIEKRIANSNAILNKSIFAKTISNSNRPLVFEKSVPNSNNDTHPFQESSKKNIENTERLFCSIPISNIKQFQFQNPNSEMSLENSGMPVDGKKSNARLSLRHEFSRPSKETQILSPAQARIKKIFSTSNNNSPTNIELNNSITKTKDNTGIFKIPQPVQLKGRTRNTSAPVESSVVNDKIQTTIDINSIKMFCVKSNAMNKRIRTRIDEWICCFMQIMEDVLYNLLQKSRVCMSVTVAPLTFHDTLNCIKMLYGSHKNIREAIDKLSKMLERCICIKDKLKTCVKPDDFMKTIGYGMQLILALKIILPLSEELKEAEVRLRTLLTNLESDSKDLDPELVKTPSDSRTDVDGKDEEIRPNFLKEQSYVIDYLKKHFKEWALYKEEFDNPNRNTTRHDNTRVKVVRTIGKNLNLLKIDKSKSISFTKNTTEIDLPNQSEDGPKIVRLLENNQLNNYDKKENNTNNNVDTKIIGHFNNYKYLKKYNTVIEMTNDYQEKDIQKAKPIENIDQDPNNEKRCIEEFNIPNHGNTFMGNGEIDGPKMIRNIKIIDEYEKKIQNREPLDLDQLDYSEIYEPSEAENVEFNNIPEKNNSEKNNNFEINNVYGLTNTMCIKDFTQDVKMGNDNNFNSCPPLDNEMKNNNYTFNIDKTIAQNSKTILNNNYNTKNNAIKNFNIENNPQNQNFGNESVNCTENNEFHSDSFNDNSATVIINTENHVENTETVIKNNEINIDIDKTVQNVQDDITNDSGFENDSTYAHSLVKIFLNELSTSFKVIYIFVTKFVDEIRERELCATRKNILHNQASKSLEDMVAIIQRLKSIIKRESAEETVLKTLLLKAGMEAATDKRMTRYRQIVMKSLEQAQILQNALKIIVSTTIGDFDALSTNVESIKSSIRYFNIFE